MKELLKLPEVQLSELGLQLRLVYLEYPTTTDFKELAHLVSEIFNVNCTSKDIMAYLDLHKASEDYELESRKQKHGIGFQY